MRLLWLLLASSYHACADPALVEAAIRRMEERGQHDLIKDVRRRMEEQAGKEDEFEQHYAAAVHLQRRAEAAEAAGQQTTDPQTAALMAQIRAQEDTQKRLPDAGDIMNKIRAFEEARKPQNDLAALAASFGAEKARGPATVEVGNDAAALMAKIRADEAKKAATMPGGDDAAALMKAIRQQEAQSRVTGAAPDAAALMKEMQASSDAATPAASKLIEELQTPPKEEESETEKAAKSGDVELLKQAIRGEEAKAKKQARRRKEGTVPKGARASVSFSLERRADSVEEAGAPIVITWVSTRDDKKEGQVALLNEEAPAVQFKALVGSRFRARKMSGEPIIDFLVEFRDENFTVPAPPGTKLYKDTPPLPPNVEKTQASIKAGKALQAFEKKSRVSPPPMVNLTSTPKACDMAGLNAAFMGNDAGRILLVLRGEAFRGLHHGVEVLDEGVAVKTESLRRGLVCTPHSYKLQEAVSRAQMERIVKPLEKRDMAVDIVVASPSCSNAPVSSNLKKRWWADLQRWYGSNLKEAVLLDGVGHQTHLTAAVDAALRVSQADIYRSVLIWRVDVAPLAVIAAPPKKFGDAPTDFLDADNDEIAGVGHGHAWSFPAALLSCFRGVLDNCWVAGSTGDWAHSCAAHAAAASGLALRRGPWCYLKPKETRPWFSSATVEQAAGASQLAGWQRDRGYNVSAGMEEVRTWPWLCPRPAAPISLKADVDRALCDHLESVDEDLDCDADEADAEFCARLLTPALRAALDDDNVRAQFRCGGAARRGEL